MSPTLTFTRTAIQYSDDGRRLDIPVEYLHVGPNVLDIFADELNAWDVPDEVPLPESERDAIVAWVRDELDRRGTVYTLHEDEYLRRRAAPFRVALTELAGAPVLTYTRGPRHAVFARGEAPDGRQVVRTSATTEWTQPPSTPLTDADRRAIQSDIAQFYPGFRFV